MRSGSRFGRRFIAIILLKILQFRSTFGWALSNLVALLRWNLFSYRDLWARMRRGCI